MQARARLLVLLAALVAPSFATVVSGQDREPGWHLGRIVTDVRVEVAGVPVGDDGLLELVDTRVGEPLRMRDVRSTIDHLIGLSRFEDVRVVAEPSAQGVTLRWLLIPVRRIVRIAVTGNAVLPASDLRDDLRDRFGAWPSANRVGDMTARLKTFYADRGFPHATVVHRIEETESVPERVELVLTIEAGMRLTIGAVTVTGSSLEPPAEVLRAADIQVGQPFDLPAIEARTSAYEESLRERGYYEARIRESHALSPDGRTAAVTLDVASGPRVNLLFAGDALPDGDRDELVPIRRERSVDQDLLEDGSIAIENALRGQGYRSAQASYARLQKGSDVMITYTIARGPLHRVESVEAAGHVRLAAAEVAPLLQITPGDPFVEARANLVAAAIVELYRVRGFTQVTVKPDIQVLPTATSAGVSYRPVAIRFAIVEGAQTMVSGMEFGGTTAIPAESLRVELVLTAGKPFYRPQLVVDRDTIERAYRNQGFQSVSVTSQLAYADAPGSPPRGLCAVGCEQRVAITWTIREGDQVTVDRVLINGNDRISTALIRREITLRPGDPMSDDAMLESQRRLAALGLFRRVRITELPRTGSISRDVLIDVEEAATTTIDYGGGIEVGRIGGQAEDGSGATDELDFGPRGFFSISRRNLWGKNRSVTLFGRVTLRRGADDQQAPAEEPGYGFNDYRGLFTFREPRAFGTSGDAQVTAFVEQARRTSYTFNRRGVTSEYARRLGSYTFSGRYTFDYTKILDEQIKAEDQLAIDRLFPQVQLSKILGGVLRDSRDDVLDPQRGAVIGLDGSVAAKALGSEVGFVKAFAQGFTYRRLPGRGVVLAAGARVGLAVGFAEPADSPLEIARVEGPATRHVDAVELFPTVIRELPASERFFAGGDTTVRGFALDRLGTEETLDSQGFPQGGNGLVVFNFEARAPYWKDLQFVWFLDAGNVYKRASDIRLDELRASSGLGFRYRSPIGPLRVDWGWKLSTRLQLTGGRERSNVWHISLGQAF